MYPRPRSTEGDLATVTSWKVGDRILIIGYEDEGPRTIDALLEPHIKGVVRLDKPVFGLRYWTIGDLRPAPRSSLH